MPPSLPQIQEYEHILNCEMPSRSQIKEYADLIQYHVSKSNLMDKNIGQPEMHELLKIHFMKGPGIVTGLICTSEGTSNVAELTATGYWNGFKPEKHGPDPKEPEYKFFNKETFSQIGFNFERTTAPNPDREGVRETIGKAGATGCILSMGGGAAGGIVAPALYAAPLMAASGPVGWAAGMGLCSAAGLAAGVIGIGTLLGVRDIVSTDWDEVWVKEMEPKIEEIEILISHVVEEMYAAKAALDKEASLAEEKKKKKKTEEERKKTVKTILLVVCICGAVIAVFLAAMVAFFSTHVALVLSVTAILVLGVTAQLSYQASQSQGPDLPNKPTPTSAARVKRWGDGLEAPAAGSRHFYKQGFQVELDVSAAIAQFGHSAEHVAQIMEHGRAKASSSPTPLASVHAAALYAYTEETTLYGTLNYAMRTPHTPSKPTDTELERYADYIIHTMSALGSLPVHVGETQGKVYRGIKVLISADVYAPGKRITWQGFSSSTKKQTATLEFLNILPGRKLQGSLFVIDSISAKDIRHFSAIPSEEEVLFPPNSQFVVEKVVKGEKDKKALVNQLAVYEMTDLDVYVLKQIA